ncbi:MAG: tetratricopeptide repeat protein, partial [Armatimonadota bacterium]
RPYLLVGWLWYLVTLIPVIGLVQVGKQAMADRYTYVPLIGIFVIVAWGVPDLARRLSFGRGELSVWAGRSGIGAAVAIVAVLAFATHRQAAYWRNDNSIWTRALAVTKNNAFAHYNLGTTLATQGDSDGAIRHFREAVRIDPRKFDAYCNLGVMLAQKGDLDEAIKHFRAAVKLKPGDPVSRSNLGLALVKRGQYAEAIPHLRAALKANPEDADSREALAVAVEQTQRAK